MERYVKRLSLPRFLDSDTGGRPFMTKQNCCAEHHWNLLDPWLLKCDLALKHSSNSKAYKTDWGYFHPGLSIFHVFKGSLQTISLTDHRLNCLNTHIIIISSSSSIEIVHGVHDRQKRQTNKNKKNTLSSGDAIRALGGRPWHPQKLAGWITVLKRELINLTQNFDLSLVILACMAPIGLCSGVARECGDADHTGWHPPGGGIWTINCKTCTN